MSKIIRTFVKKNMEKKIIIQPFIKYYKIYVDKSILNFDSALLKLGFYDDFYKQWDYDENIKNIENNNYIYLTSYVDNNDIEFYLDKNLTEIKKHYNFKDFVFGDEIKISKEDIENLDEFLNVKNKINNDYGKNSKQKHGE